jgi:hypothetical protein
VTIPRFLCDTSFMHVHCIVVLACMRAHLAGIEPLDGRVGVAKGEKSKSWPPELFFLLARLSNVIIES